MWNRNAALARFTAITLELLFYSIAVAGLTNPIQNEVFYLKFPNNCF